MRNVDGAIFPGAEQTRIVSCHSSADPKSVEDAERTAHRAAAAALRALDPHDKGED
jgi:hypothetical protein